MDNRILAIETQVDSDVNNRQRIRSRDLLAVSRENLDKPAEILTCTDNLQEDCQYDLLDVPRQIRTQDQAVE